MPKQLKALEKSEEFLGFLKAWDSGRSFRVTGASGSAPAFILSQAYLRCPRPFVAITTEEKKAENIKLEIEGLVGQEIHLYPSLEVLPEDEIQPDPVLVGERYKILGLLKQGAPEIPLLVTTISALKQHLPSPKKFNQSILRAEEGREADLESIVRWLVGHGYENQNPVLEKGQFARRGGIVDVYPGHCDYPARIEFCENKIASLRFFDPQSQRSLSTTSRIEIYPASPDDRGRSSFYDYLPSEYHFIWIEPFSREEMRKFSPPKKIFPSVFFDIYGPPPSDSPVPVKAQFSISTLEKFKYKEAPVLYPILESLGGWLKEGYRIIICAHNPGEVKRLKEILRERGIPPHPRFCFQLGELSQGFIWEEPRLVVVGDGEIFSRYQIPRPRQKYLGKVPALRPAEFRPGDYVIHLDHGIGKYLGIKKLRVTGRTREMLTIKYAAEARLYVPLTQSHLISRYMGIGKKPPILDRLGGSRWLKAKIAAQKAVNDLAAELLEVQASRETLPGYPFSPDTSWQKEFEAAFIYPETPDQAQVIAEIKNDMESSTPMDRLLCGDVGYGKTEVAIRAAFKAVMDGKQVAVLVPTTVLAQQHFQTFKERISDYPLRVEMLSRFLTAQEQKAVINGLAKGSVDIVIGTHRLLQADLTFKDLGLVVIDEEQRFGVRHKERFKQMRRLIDVLTMTATPIPRTLYLSLSRARDLSTINTPPQDRLAVETRVLPYDPEKVRPAILRELERKGQVYYVHNRVKDIERVREKLQHCFPELVVASAHGQMDERELAQVMKLFTKGKIDVLVCTTIIESGLDIPNANTIIVEHSERFGLADLYQLRGRVGRFKHRAYAYFFFPPSLFLEEGARKRLRAIEEFSHLGAGFSLALRDLEIRGAGNILGREQHGHIAAVGFQLYCRLLRMSIKQLRGESEKGPPQVKIEFDFFAGLPPAYIEEERQRIEMYQKWANLAERKQITCWVEELQDRFGPLPDEVRALAALAELKLAAGARGITSIGRAGGDYFFRRAKKIILVTKCPPPVSVKQSTVLAKNLIKKCQNSITKQIGSPRSRKS